MLIEQFHTAIASARTTAALDDAARLLWRAHAEGHIADADAEALSAAVGARRAAIARPAAGVRLGTVAAVRAPRRPPRSPDRQASLERRRRQAASGAMPPALAAMFTGAELAALAVVAREAQKSGACTWPIDRIAAVAGTSRSVVKRAIRAAEENGLLLRRERRRRGDRSDTNILTVVSREWRAWLARGPQGGGGQTRTATGTDLSRRGETGENSRPAEARNPRKGIREAIDRTPSARPATAS